MTTSETPVREMFAAPRPQDGTLDFSIELSFLAAVATNENSAWNSGVDASFNTAFGESYTFSRAFST